MGSTSQRRARHPPTTPRSRERQIGDALSDQGPTRRRAASEHRSRRRRSITCRNCHWSNRTTRRVHQMPAMVQSVQRTCKERKWRQRRTRSTHLASSPFLSRKPGQAYLSCGMLHYAVELLQEQRYTRLNPMMSPSEFKVQRNRRPSASTS